MTPFMSASVRGVTPVKVVGVISRSISSTAAGQRPGSSCRAASTSVWVHSR